MGYYVSEYYWGNGIGTSAVKQTCNYVFENTDIIRIFAEPFAHNAASCRILEKSGFEYEGTLRNNAVKNGVVLAHRRAAFDHDVSVDSCTFTDLNARSGNGIRPDFYVVIQFRLSAYQCGSVYLAHAFTARRRESLFHCDFHGRYFGLGDDFAIHRSDSLHAPK